jgi:putative DNA primase/helicase
MIDREPRAFPTMLAAYSDPSGELVQVERLFLTPGGQKAPIANPKRLMPQWKNSCMDGAAVRLYEPAERMGIAEGIATALRCSSESDLPVWATGSRIWMEKVWIPPMVQELIIFADNDESGDGLRSAKKLASRAVADGLKVKVVVPPKVGADWDDVVCEDVCQ